MFHEWPYSWLERIWYFKASSGAYCKARGLSMTYRYVSVNWNSCLCLCTGVRSMWFGITITDMPTAWTYEYTVN